MSENDRTYVTPRGNPVVVLTRSDTADDALVNGILGSDEYRLAELDGLQGVALDIGAHIGTVAFALLADHPGLKVVAVEAIPDNVDLIRRGGASFVGQGRLTVLEAGACDYDGGTVKVGYDYTSAGDIDPDYVSQNRFIGGIWRDDAKWEGKTAEVPGVSLRGLAAAFAPDGFSFCKIDCEGCEYPFLADGAELIELIVGEWHDDAGERIVELLSPTHEVTILDNHGGSGIFRAQRR